MNNWKYFHPGDTLVVPHRLAEVGDRVEVCREYKWGYPKVDLATVTDVNLEVGWRGEIYWVYRVQLDRMTKPTRYREANTIRTNIVDGSTNSEVGAGKGYPYQFIRRIEEPTNG